MIIDHIDLYAADTDRALDPHRDMIGIIADPDRHLLPSLEHGALDQQWLELDGAEFTISRSDRFFSKIADIEMIDLPIQEHVDIYLVIRLEMAEIDISRIEDSAQHILYAGGNGIDPLCSDRRIRALHEGHVLIGLLAAFVHIADEFIGLEGGGVDIRLIAIPYFKEFIIKAIGLSIPYYMIDVLSVKFFERGRE